MSAKNFLRASNGSPLLAAHDVMANARTFHEFTTHPTGTIADPSGL
jgi:hypothetical protein